MTKDSISNYRTKVKKVTKMHPIQSIGYAAAYPAYPLNPPLGITANGSVKSAPVDVVDVYGHTTLKAPVLVRSPKLSNVGPG